MLRLVLLLVALSAFLAACGGDGAPRDAAGIEGSPESAIAQVLALVNKQQWGREWDSLHPDQQTLVAREKFVSCSKAADRMRIGSVKVLSVNDEETAIAGTGKRAPSKAVAVQYELSVGSRKGKSVDIFYLFDLDGQWRWVLSNASIEAYKSGSCPA